MNQFLMQTQIKAEKLFTVPVLSIVKSPYIINENYLYSLGFEKNEVLSGPEEWVYRYYNFQSGKNGIELQFLYEFGILSIEEFWQNTTDNDAYFPHVIVGKFRISCDDDLHFIFSKNIRLNYIFNVASKRV